MARRARDVICRGVTLALAGAALLAAPALGAPPTVTITNPLSGTITNKPTPSFSGTAEELGQPVTLRIYRGDPADEDLARKITISVVLPGGAWTSGPIEELADGGYTATASQMNAASETGTSAPVAFTIDRSPPTVALGQPDPEPGETTPSFTGTASDIEPVVIQVHEGESVEGPIVSFATATGTRSAWRSGPVFPPLAIGRYTAVAIQESSLGNPAGRSAPVSFQVVPVPPAAPVHAVPDAGVAAQLVSAPPRGPALMAPFPVVRVAGVAFRGGVRLRLLSVTQAPPGALVRVRCRGGGCPARRVRRATAGTPPLVFHSFERYLRAGAVIEVFVTKGGVLGKYTRLRVRRGKLPERVDLCLDATGVKPVACPAA